MPIVFNVVVCKVARLHFAMLGRSSIWLVALAGVVQAATKELTDTCSGGGAFGLYRRESGCAIGNCDCFPIIYECDGHLADGMGQCALSRNTQPAGFEAHGVHTLGVGWSLILLAFAINLIVPAVFLVSHNIMELAKDKAVSSNSDEHVPNAMDQSKQSHGQYVYSMTVLSSYAQTRFYIDLRQVHESTSTSLIMLTSCSFEPRCPIRRSVCAPSPKSSWRPCPSVGSTTCTRVS